MKSLALAESKRIQWSSYLCGCGETAEHLSDDFAKLLLAQSADDVLNITLDGHIEDQAMVFDVALPAISVIMASLSDNISQFTRGYFMVTLWRIVLGEPATETGDIIAKCVLVARSGLWQLYREAVSGDTETALEILSEVDLDRERFEYFKSALGGRVN
ncbi:hypothetical protein ACWCYY_14680 [Kitasatospora sp. NPDC001664]